MCVVRKSALNAEQVELAAKLVNCDPEWEGGVVLGAHNFGVGAEYLLELATSALARRPASQNAIGHRRTAARALAGFRPKNRWQTAGDEDYIRPGRAKPSAIWEMSKEKRER